MQHDTYTALIYCLSSAFGFGAAAAPVAFFYLRKRSGQNSALEEAIAARMLINEKKMAELASDLGNAVDEIRKLERQLELSEKAGTRAAEQLRSEMHGLSGRVDAANEKYTEILVAFKARSSQPPASGQKIDEAPPVTGNVAFKEEKRKK